MNEREERVDDDAASCDEVMNHFNETVALQVALCMLLVALITFSYVCQRVVENPLRTWYDEVSHRWFRMRATFITARRLRKRKENDAIAAGRKPPDATKTPWSSPWATAMEAGNTLYNLYCVSLAVLLPEALLIGLLNRADEPEMVMAMVIGCVLCFLSVGNCAGLFTFTHSFVSHSLYAHD